MGVGPLRVWNDDRVAPGKGFDPHPHRDMEIITYVRRGAVTHRDNLGNEGRTAAGDVQVMSAGTGIVHAEYNLDDEPLELFQIWIQPRTRGLEPRWAQRAFPVRWSSWPRGARVMRALCRSIRMRHCSARRLPQASAPCTCWALGARHIWSRRVAASK
jgi:redox-sensitive bicupin YhaK (pirin superfamily)